MSSQRFTRVGTLRAIDPQLLERFLEPYAGFLRARGVSWPLNGPDPLDYGGLAGAFMRPDEDTPHDLCEALYFIDELATAEGVEQLLAAVAQSRVVIPIRVEATPEDIAIQVWLADRGIVERKHAELQLVRPKSFEYFQSETAPRPLRTIPQEKLLALEKDLNDWFVDNGRGRTSKVFAFPKGDETWFLIRRGDHYKREGDVKDGQQPVSVFLRPEAFDVVVYNGLIGEIRIHAGTEGIKGLYRQQFGRHFFEDDDFFPASRKSKYTLEPLRLDGDSALVCADVEGLDWVRLRELHFYWGGAFNEVEIRRASDLLAALAWRGYPISAKARMVCAKFEIKFTGVKKSRMLTIRPPNIASFTRKGDSVLCDIWLAKRGLAMNQGPVADKT